MDLGLPVSIELPDETNISGTISEIGEIAVIPTGNQGEPYLEIGISLDGAKNFESGRLRKEFHGKRAGVPKSFFKQIAPLSRL